MWRQEQFKAVLTKPNREVGVSGARGIQGSINVMD